MEFIFVAATKSHKICDCIWDDDGVMVGCVVGIAVGLDMGLELGAVLVGDTSAAEGTDEGSGDRGTAGFIVGDKLGTWVGETDGVLVKAKYGDSDGTILGSMKGRAVLGDGAIEGMLVGIAVGASVHTDSVPRFFVDTVDKQLA